MRELSLFTGAGGGLLGSMLLGWRTVAAVEWDAYCQRVLCARGGYMADAEGKRVRRQGRVEQDAGNGREDAQSRGSFPVYSDVRTFHPVPGSCDIVTGGFPCQPFSQAGKRLGEDDPRNMWPHAVRVLRESGAPLALWENVPGLLSAHRKMCAYHWHPVQWFDGRYYCAKCRGRVADAAVLTDYYFGTILRDLAEAGFDAEWCVLGADDVGAPHRRKRLWILAYRTDDRTGWRQQLAQRRQGSRDVADSDSRRRQQRDPRLGPVPEPDAGSPWRIDPADVGHGDEPGSQGHGHDGERAGERAAGAAGDEQDVPDAVPSGCGGRSQVPGREPCGRAAVGGTGPGCGPSPDRESQSELGGLPHGLACGLGRCVPRVAVGVPERVNRLRALGNGQVPQCMAAAFTYLARQAGVTPSCT